MLTNASTVGRTIATLEDGALPRSATPCEIERLRCDDEGRVLRVSGWLPLACRLDKPTAVPEQS
jgi:hypothetical protein